MADLLPAAGLERKIFLIRGLRVMLDSNLAELYGVSTKRLNEQVRRNSGRFPEDFMFHLTQEEARLLRSQIVTLEYGRGRYSKYLPSAFTEQGVAMLSSVLGSERAVQVNIAIMRAFVGLRRTMLEHADLARKLEALEERYDAQFTEVFAAIKELMTPPEEPPREIGFKV